MLRKKNDSRANSRFLTLLCASSCPCCWSFQCLVAFSPQKSQKHFKCLQLSALNVTRQQPDKWISAVESDSNFVLFPHVPTCLSDPFPPSFRRTVTIVSVTLLYAKVPQSHNILAAGGCCLFSLAGAFRLRSSAGHFVSAFFIGCPWLEHTWYACCTWLKAFSHAHDLSCAEELWPLFIKPRWIRKVEKKVKCKTSPNGKTSRFPLSSFWPFEVGTPQAFKCVFVASGSKTLAADSLGPQTHLMKL